MLTDVRGRRAAPSHAGLDFALCSQMDPELWFPEPWEDETPAKLICGGCLARNACLAFALNANEEYGIWAGLSPDERRAMRKPISESASALALKTEGEAA